MGHADEPRQPQRRGEGVVEMCKVGVTCVANEMAMVEATEAAMEVAIEVAMEAATVEAIEAAREEEVVRRTSSPPHQWHHCWLPRIRSRGRMSRHKWSQEPWPRSQANRICMAPNAGRRTCMLPKYVHLSDPRSLAYAAAAHCIRHTPTQCSLIPRALMANAEWVATFLKSQHRGEDVVEVCKVGVACVATEMTVVEAMEAAMEEATEAAMVEATEAAMVEAMEATRWRRLSPPPRRQGRRLSPPPRRQEQRRHNCGGRRRVHAMVMEVVMAAVMKVVAVVETMTVKARPCTEWMQPKTLGPSYGHGLGS